MNPHSRNKRTRSGSAGVGRGRRVDVGGPVGSGVRPPSSPSSPSSPSRSSGGSRGLGGGSAVGLVALFALLPKKLRRVLLLILAAVVLFSAVRSCGESSSLGVIGGADGPTSVYVSGPGLGSDSGSSSQSYVNPFASALSAATPAPAAQSAALDLSVASGARDKRVTPLGGGRDTVTVMVYMCGTDLESKYGMGTSDLTEMTKADISDKVNVIVETGGCKSWKNDAVSNASNQVYRVRSGGLERLESDFGSASMTSADNLSRFIDYCEAHYPADRCILILWDHGGGSITGFGYDETKVSSGSMSLASLDRALSDADCVFDWIGFDACLMGNLETALVCADYADYLIASEEVEPGTGWYYTDWLSSLSANTSVATPELAREIIDGYVSACTRRTPSAQVTLSLVDLAQLEGTVPPVFTAFSSSMNQMLDAGNYSSLADARSGARQFSVSSRINQVDLVDLALRVGNEDAQQLADAVRACVKYNGSTISRSYGVSIYFPYESLSNVNSALSAYSSLGMDEEYSRCIKSFASLGYGGQLTHTASQSDYYDYSSYADVLGELFNSYSSSSSPSGFLNGSFANVNGAQSSGYSLGASDIFGLLSSFSGRSMPAEFSWVDTELVAASAGALAENMLDASHVYASYKDGRAVLSLSEQEWSLIKTVELNLFADDGEGYIDLGRDNVFDFDGNDLLLSFDGTWLTVDGHAAAYYLVSDVLNDDGTWTTTGRIPALLNGEAVNLRVVFDDAHPYGAVTGAYPLYLEGETDAVAKGEVALAPGDELELLCDFYDYAGNYDASYTLGAPFTLTSAEPELANMRLDASGLRATYRLTDLYGNHYWVEIP